MIDWMTNKLAQSMFVLSWSFYPHSPPCSKQQSKTDSHTNQRSNAECVVKGSQGCAQIMGAEFPTLARSPPVLGVETLGIPKWAMFKPRNTIPSYLLARNGILSGWWSSPVPNYPNFYWILDSKIPEKLPTKIRSHCSSGHGFAMRMLNLATTAARFEMWFGREKPIGWVPGTFFWNPQLINCGCELQWAWVK